jgi:hypothetical protein
VIVLSFYDEDDADLSQLLALGNWREENKIKSRTPVDDKNKRKKL